jgi:hypothetical protein
MNSFGTARLNFPRGTLFNWLKMDARKGRDERERGPQSGGPKDDNG